MSSSSSPTPPALVRRRQRVVVLGGGVAGVTCAERVAALGACDVTLVTGAHSLKVVKNIIDITRNLQRFEVGLVSSEDFARSLAANVRLVTAFAESVDTRERVVHLSDGTTVAYDSLAVCTGASPKLAVEHPCVIGIRDLDSVTDLQRRLSSARRVVLVGNGGIALEVAYALRRVELVWAVKDDFVGNTFLDKAASAFTLPFLFPERDPDTTVERLAVSRPSSLEAEAKAKGKGKREEKEGAAVAPNNKNNNNSSSSSKRRQKVDCRRAPGSALGPQWVESLLEKAPAAVMRRGTGADHQPNTVMQFECEIARVADGTRGWPLEVTLTNGAVVGCDVLVSATGVVPNAEFLGAEFARGPDGGVRIDAQCRTSVEGVFAAGDVCSCAFEDEEPHWFQMRLWGQARLLGIYCAHALTGNVDEELGFNFELFAHATQVFGKNVVLLGRFNGQGLDPSDCHIIVRCKPGESFIKLTLVDWKLVGATLVGDTDLAETFENLILDGLDLSAFGDDLLREDVDLDDFFD